MHNKYMIGFFAAIFIITAMVGIGYQLEYRYIVKNNITEEEENTNAVQTEGEATKNEGYFLCELNGYVVVYLFDQKTIYEYTSILVDDLPEPVKGQVLEVKYVETTEELYGFLENYSS